MIRATLIKCVVLFHIVVAVPLANYDINKELIEEANVRMTSPSYIRSLENPPESFPLDHTIFNVPVSRNLNSDYSNNNQFSQTKEIVSSDLRQIQLQNNINVKGIPLNELKLPPNQQNQEENNYKLNELVTKYSQEPYQNINSNSWRLARSQKETNSQIGINVNRPPENIQKPLNSFQRWHELYAGSSTLQNILSNSNIVRNILAPETQKKQFIVVYPNGTIRHEDNLEIIANQYPNHIVINANDIQELSKVHSKIRSHVYKQPQQIVQNVISSSIPNNYNTSPLTPTNAKLLLKSETEPQHNIVASSYATDINESVNNSRLVNSTVNNSDNNGSESVVSKISEVNLPFSFVTKLQGLNNDTNKSISTRIEYRTIQAEAKPEISDNMGTVIKKVSTTPEKDKQFNDINSKSVNAVKNNNITNIVSDTKKINAVGIKNTSSIIGTTDSKSIIEKKETKDNPPKKKLVNDTIVNITKPLDVGTNVTKIVNDTEKVNSSESEHQPLEELFKFDNLNKNYSSNTDTRIDSEDKNVTNSKNLTIRSNDANDANSVTDVGHITMDSPDNNNFKNRLANEGKQNITTITNVISQQLFNDTYNVTNTPEEDAVNELNNNDTEKTTTDSEFLKNHSLDDNFEENETINGLPWEHDYDYEDDEINIEDNSSANLEVEDKKPNVWLKTNKENIGKTLFGDKGENQNIYFMFYEPPETPVERETKTTIYPNGTIVEEYTEIRKSLDGGPTIKTSTITTYNVGVVSDSNN